MRKLLIVLGVIIVLIAITIYTVIGNLDAIAKNAIEHFGSEVTQTAVRVKKVHIDLTKGAGAIYGLTVANPTGFSGKPVLSLGEASVKFDLKALSKDLIVIERLTVNKPEVNYEMDAKRQGNLNQLYNNISKSMPSGGGRTTGSGQAEAGPKLLIRKLDFSSGAISALIVPLNNKTYPAKLPAIHMTNLGAPKGATGGEIAKEVLSRLTKTARDEVQKQVMDKYVNKELNKIKSQVNSRIESEKKKAEQSLKEQTEQKLKDLLKR
ncbi:MAG: hypothetical protein P8141_08225 [Gammaproteobacteria bacterium]